MSKIDIIVPEGQLEGTKATLSSWLVELGAQVEKDQPIVELETDKVSMEIAAPAAGVLTECLLQPGDSVALDAKLGVLQVGTAAGEPEPAAAAAAAAAAPQTEQSIAEPVADDNPRQWRSPAVRRLLREHAVDLAQVIGTGKGGRVTKKDLLAYLANPAQASAPAPLAVKPAAVAPAGSSLAAERRPHSTMRKRIAEHMVESLLQTAPHVTSVFEADLTAIQRHRAAHKADFAQRGVKLTYTAYFVSACVAALRAVPEVNSRFYQDALELYQDCNIGIGVALGNDGLVVPVLKQAQQLNLEGIAGRLQQLTDAAQQGKLTPPDLRDGTFTISNHGVSGSLVAAPIIINQPQSAILGIGKLQKRVVVREVDGVDTMQIRPMSYITLTIDHRALDGYQTNQFLSVVVDTLEKWPLD